MLDPQESLEEIKIREVELCSESWTSFASDEVTQQQCYGHYPSDCSTQQLKQQLRGTLVTTQWRMGHCLNIFIVLAAVHGLPGRSAQSSLHSFFPPPPPPLPFPLSSSLIIHLASVDVKQNVYFTEGVWRFGRGDVTLATHNFVSVTFVMVALRVTARQAFRCLYVSSISLLFSLTRTK